MIKFNGIKVGNERVLATKLVEDLLKDENSVLKAPFRTNNNFFKMTHWYGREQLAKCYLSAAFFLKCLSKKT